VPVYEDVQDLLDDDRWVKDDSLRWGGLYKLNAVDPQRERRLVSTLVPMKMKTRFLKVCFLKCNSHRATLRLMMEKESVMWSMLAVDAPLAVRPGGVEAAAHLLGCLRLMHVEQRELDYLRDDEVPRVGHSTFVWTEGPPGGMWDAGGSSWGAAAAAEAAAAEEREVEAGVKEAMAAVVGLALFTTLFCTGQNIN
jgi:hypothetical protein